MQVAPHPVFSSPAVSGNTGLLPLAVAPADPSVPYTSSVRVAPRVGPELAGGQVNVFPVPKVESEDDFSNENMLKFSTNVVSRV